MTVSCRSKKSLLRLIAQSMLNPSTAYEDDGDAGVENPAAVGIHIIISKGAQLLSRSRKQTKTSSRVEQNTKPGSGQGTDEKGLRDLEPPTGPQLATPNTAICGARDEIKIRVCHPHDPSDPTGVFIFPCRASKWHYYSL